VLSSLHWPPSKRILIGSSFFDILKKTLIKWPVKTVNAKTVNVMNHALLIAVNVIVNVILVKKVAALDHEIRKII
jgi:hypothetical protein